MKNYKMRFRPDNDDVACYYLLRICSMDDQTLHFHHIAATKKVLSHIDILETLRAA